MPLGPKAEARLESSKRASVFGVTMARMVLLLVGVALFLFLQIVRDIFDE